ncbi:hypothetical protein IFM89_013031 [Coptis chinensis]|uniref:Pentatricopeptide repeat-containing protein n=1 Tax=Coptis chinensis TaxID=261450 RepID=A0A835GZ33_9MAGN|nr:hypothetical protein IFM89_013031 [Coptis chinensis]
MGFREMKNCGFEPDRDTFNTLISAYGRCGSGIVALKMYDEIIRVGFRPSVTTYNSLRMSLDHEVIGEQPGVILDMKSKGFKPNETSTSLMLHCYATPVCVDIRGIEAIEEEIYSGEIFPSWMLLRTLVLANSKSRDKGGMERAFKELGKKGYKPDLVLCNSMLSIFAKNRMYNQAHEMGMFVDVHDVISYMMQQNI